MTHAERIQELSAAFSESMTRFLARLDRTPATTLQTAPASGGWSPAQVAWHVTAINEAFAGLIDGSIPQAQPPAGDFVETPWQDLASRVPDKLDAPQRFHPPADVTASEVLPRLRASREHLLRALATLTEDRSGYTVRSIVGTPINLYQVGNWAAAHVARHNAQVKRILS